VVKQRGIKYANIDFMPREIANPEYNPTTGRIEPQKLDMFAGLSDEQREWEASFLSLFSFLTLSGT
jgi:hypothetical protein